MIIHDKKLLDDLALLKEADSLQKGGFINKEQKNTIKKELPDFKAHNNILVRLIFFLLGSFLYLSICGMISLFSYAFLGLGLSLELSSIQIYCYLFAGIGFAGAEFLSNQKYYRHGLDDAFILGMLMSIGFAVAITTEGYEFIIAIFVAISSFLAYRRYLHLLSMLVFCLALSAVLYYGMLELGTIGITILIFTFTIFAGIFYFFTKERIKKLTESYYYNGLLLANSFCLVLFCFSSNYLIVRELSAELLTYEVLPGQHIPFAIFFYSFALLIVPIIYLIQALRTKDRIMLWIGFLAFAFSILKIQFYYTVLPIDIVLILGGMVLFTIAYFSIKKIKNNESGVTFKFDRINNSDIILNAEALVVASAFSIKPEIKTESPMEFGGGDFSGGGSGGTF